MYETELADIRHKDELGFHDITTNTTPSPALLNFLNTIIPEQAEKYSDRFVSNKPLFDRVAKALADKKLPWSDRHTLWNDVKAELGIFDRMAGV